MPSSRHTIHGSHHHFGWDHSIPPVLRVAPGATIEFECVDAGGGQVTEASTAGDMTKLDFGRVNPVTGPVYVDPVHIPIAYDYVYLNE